MAGDTRERPAEMKVFGIIGAFGAVSLISSLVSIYALTRHLGDSALGFEDVPLPGAVLAMFWFGFAALIVGASGISGLRLLKIVSILGTVILAIGFGWLILWEHLLMGRGAGYLWESPDAPVWMIGSGCVLLAFSGVLAIVVNGFRWGRVASKRLRSSGTP